MTVVPNRGVTKAEHDRHVAARGRPFTDDSMQRRTVSDEAPSDVVSLVDQYTKGETA
jgi:hypothetical protein